MCVILGNSLFATKQRKWQSRLKYTQNYLNTRKYTTSSPNTPKNIIICISLKFWPKRNANYEKKKKIFTTNNVVLFEYFSKPSKFQTSAARSDYDI